MKRKIVQAELPNEIPIELLSQSEFYNIGIENNGIRSYVLFKSRGNTYEYYIKSFRSFNITADTDVARKKSWSDLLSVLKTHECHIFDTSEELASWMNEAEPQIPTSQSPEQYYRSIK